MREQRLAGQSRRKHRGGRRKQEDAPGAVGEPDEQSERDEDADQPHASDPLEQDVDIQGRAFSQIHRVSVEKGLRGLSPLVAQE